MLIKRKAVFRGEIFTRMFWKYEMNKNVCDDCKCIYRDNASHTNKYCKLCDILYNITRLEDYDINYGWIIKEKDRKD